MTRADTLTRKVWRQDFTAAAKSIPEAWLVRDGNWTGIAPEHAAEPIVDLYAKLTQVGYARGWL